MLFSQLQLLPWLAGGAVASAVAAAAADARGRCLFMIAPPPLLLQ